jgi:hypothetical protein
MYLCIHIDTHLSKLYLYRLQAVLESKSKYAWSWWSSELSDTLWGCDWASLEMHLEAENKWNHRCTWRPCSSEFGDALGGHDAMNWVLNFEAIIKQVWRCTCRLWLSEIGRVIVEVVILEGVDGRHTGCWDSIHWLVNLKLWESNKVTLLKILWRTGWWQSIYREEHWKL